MFMPQVSYNQGIFDCFSSGICLGLHLIEADRCLCLGLKSIAPQFIFFARTTTIFLSSIFKRKFRCRNKFHAPSSSTSRVFLLSFSSNSLILASNFTFSLSPSSNFENSVFCFSSTSFRPETLDCTNSTRFLCSAMFSLTSR